MNRLLRLFPWLLFGLWLSTPAGAQFEEANWQPAGADLQITQGPGFFAWSRWQFAADVAVTNTTGQPLEGGVRVVIPSSTLAALEADGTTAGGEPYFLFIDDNGSLAPGETLTRQLYFALTGFVLDYTTRAERYSPPQVPALTLDGTSVDFGDVYLGVESNATLTLGNDGGATLSVSDISSDQPAIGVFPPRQFQIAAGGPLRTVTLGFTPETVGAVSGTVTITSNDPDQPGATITVTGNGIAPVEPGDINAVSQLDFGVADEEESVGRTLTVSNQGNGPLTVSAADIDNGQFALEDVLLNALPFTLAPDQSRNLTLSFTPAVGSGGTTVSGTLSLTSDDPDQPQLTVALSGDGVVPQALDNVPVLSARVHKNPFDLIDADNCGNVRVEVVFDAEASPADTFVVTLSDQAGNRIDSPARNVPAGGGLVEIFLGDSCGILRDGVVTVEVEVFENGQDALNVFTGNPAGKATGDLPAPLLDPLEPVSLLGNVTLCGQARQHTIVSIDGGASPVSVALAADEDPVADGLLDFCLEVPLRRNTENLLIATVTDNLTGGPTPRAVASAAPVSVIHLDPDEIVVAEATSRPLTTEEVETLVDNGVIDLNDPGNFNVSMFTVVFTIGDFPITVSQPVVVDPTPGSVSYGSGGGGGSGPGGGGGGGGGGSSPGGGGSTSSVVVITPPVGPTIPGVIIIDGRIKTLKEFFQVTLALQNTSASFTLADILAEIRTPAGVTPVRAAPGSDVSAVSTADAVDQLTLDPIGPGGTGTGQFIVRGDRIGSYGLDIDFGGIIDGGGLPQPVPFAGTVASSIEVHGPPQLDVVVRHPSRVGDDDVRLNEIYTLTVEITNRDQVPARYTSLELFVGGQSLLVDALGNPVANSQEVRNFGHIRPGQSVSASFRIQSLVQGEIIACQAVASENLNLSIDTGPDGTGCNILNSLPAAFESLPADLAPTVIAINPLNGQADQPITTSVFATLTPEAACLVADTWTNVVTAPINPADPGSALEVISATLVTAGTFYLEELDPLGNAVDHVPTDLTVETPPAGGTTIAVLRLGLESPLSQYFLKPNTTYRATLKGGQGGICSASSGAVPDGDFVWTFTTEQTCDGTPLTVSLADPANGAIDRPLNQSVTLDFSRAVNPATLGFVPGNLAASTFGVYANAVAVAGSLVDEGSPVAGTVRLTGNYTRLEFHPSANLPEGATVHVRLTNGLEDRCGEPLAGTETLFSFQTAAADATPPAAPLVNPLPASPTAQASVRVSGSAEANATVIVSGPAGSRSATAGAGGAFAVTLPLMPDADNALTVVARDASGNESPVQTRDTANNPLKLFRDATPPVVIDLTPVPGGSNVPRDIAVKLTFSEELAPGTVNALNVVLAGVSGRVVAEGGNGVLFIPDALLDYDRTYTLRVRSGGITDRAGNALEVAFETDFTTEAYPAPRLDGLSPDHGLQGSTVEVMLTGSGLASPTALTIDGSGVSLADLGGSATQRNLRLTLDPAATPGVRLLTLTTAGGSASAGFLVLPPPQPAEVYPLPQRVAGTRVTVMGSAAPDAVITITGGEGSASGIADIGGYFSVDVDLTPNAINDLTVSTEDAYGNAAAPTTVDFIGEPLRVISDTLAPTVAGSSPVDGSSGAALDTAVQVTLSEHFDSWAFDPTRVTLEEGGSAVSGTVTVSAPDQILFTPDSDLLPARTYNLRIGADALHDLAGNPPAADLTVSFTTVTSADMDLNTWQQEGPSSAGNWQVSPDGQTVYQLLNGNPTFFVGPEPVINQTITGRFAVETGGDDDYIGFVFGYQAPLGSLGHGNTDYDFLLFDWKQTLQNGSPAGFTLSRVTGNSIPFINHGSDQSGYDVVRLYTGNGRGWLDYIEYNFTLEYFSDRIRISIQSDADPDFVTPQVIFDVTPDDVYGANGQGFIPGRFGFYNYSQSNVRYAGFVQDFPLPPPSPVVTAPASVTILPGTSQRVTFTGQDLGTVYRVESAGGGLSTRIERISADGTSLTAVISTSDGAPGGSYPLTLRGLGGDATVEIIVN